MQTLPEPLKALVEQLSGLPGLGPKSALRMALAVLKWPETRARQLGKSILVLRDKLTICGQCGGLSDRDPCDICADPGRQEDVLCLVSEWDSLLALEQGGFYRGRYMILGGLLDPLEGTDIESLDLSRLRKRLGQGKAAEVILALGATLEAENTASYLRNMIMREFPGMKVTRLAQGIPLGAEVKFMDKETLKQSLLFRQEI